MRIPSQFNEHNLYRRGRGRPESPHGYRRLFRLLLALALIVVVMRQASKPAVYRAFFGTQASLSADSDRSRGPSGGEIGRRHSVTRIAAPAAPQAVAPEDRRVANLLTQEMLPIDQRQWVVALFWWQSGRPHAVVPANLEAIGDLLESLENITDQQRLAWHMMFESFIKSTKEQDADGLSAPTSSDRPRVAAFLAALDDAAASRVVDGSVWRSEDFDSFYRYLDAAGDLPTAGIAATGVLPLLQQPDVFRNQLVRVHGGVARAQRVDAKENPFGITEYWQLWLRPADGVDRPLVAIVPTVPVMVESVGPDAIAQEGPQVTVVGRFLKRLAYESAMGADLAPVVVGRIVFDPVAESKSSDRVAIDDALSNRLWLTVAVASLFGFALAAVAIWRTSTMAKRARGLRTAHRKEPDEFLKGLGDTADHIESTNEVTE